MSIQMEEEAIVGKMGNKFKKSKKKGRSDLEEVTDCTVVENVDVENNLNFRQKDNKKTNKKNHVVAADAKVDGVCDETVNGEGYVNLDKENQLEKVQKKKKNKRVSKSGEVVIDCPDATPLAEASSSNLSKEDKKMKSTEKHEVGGDAKVSGSRDEDQTDKDPKKKKKKRKLGPSEDKNTLHDKNQTEVKETRSFQTKDSVGKGMANKTRDKEVGKGEKSSEKEDITEIEKTEEGDRRKKHKKRMRENEDNNGKGKKKTKDRKENENPGMECGKVHMEKVKRKKMKTEKIKDKDGHAHLYRHKTQNAEASNGKISKSEKTKSVEKNDSENPKPKEKSKKVRFSGQVEVFPSSDHKSSGKEKDQEDGLIRGKRFSREEDEIVKTAVLSYIEEHGLGEEGLKMVLTCKSHPQIKNCWKDIGAALPHRPYTAIYYRAHILFERDEKHEWTEEDYDLIHEFQKKHGNNWKALAEELGKHRIHVKDTWRRIKLTNQNKGHWSQEEYQNLFDLVNMDLRMKASEEKRSKHGMLRDNICWGAISDKLSTRSNSTCCMKWYRQLTSPMVADGIWADSDDYRLLDALFNLDACCIEDVNWDDLVDQRSGDVCRKRWDQMVLHIGLHGEKSFAEQVEILAKRYCPDLLEAREAWESKPVVP